MRNRCHMRRGISTPRACFSVEHLLDGYGEILRRGRCSVISGQDNRIGPGRCSLLAAITASSATCNEEGNREERNASNQGTATRPYQAHCREQNRKPDTRRSAVGQACFDTRGRNCDSRDRVGDRTTHRTRRNAARKRRRRARESHLGGRGLVDTHRLLDALT